MQDEEITLNNACADLVSLKRWEAFPLHLLGSRRAGEWIGVRELCLRIGVAADDLAPNLFAAWLPDPQGHDAYAVILFYDQESLWSMAAHYNRARLLDGASAKQAPQPASAPLPPTSGSTSQPPAPAADR